MILRAWILAISFAASTMAFGEERFAIFVRESPTGDWDGMRSAIWECVVPDGDGDPVFERKLDFGKSYSAPSKFFFGRGLSPEIDRWIRIQRKVGDEFDVALCEVDFQNWKYKEHFRASRISDLGFTAEHGFFSVKDKGMFRITFDDAKIDERKPTFEILREFEDTWLVRFDGQPDDEMSLISSDGEQILQRIPLNVQEPQKRYRAKLSHDRRWLAFFFHEEVERSVPFGGTGEVDCELILFDFQKNERFNHPFSTMASAGSGIRTLIGFDQEFSQDGSILTFVKRSPSKDKITGEGELNQISLDLETKTISSKKLEVHPEKESGLDGEAEVPEYLRESYRRFAANHWHEQRMALALIQQIGKYQYPVPTGWDQTRVGYTRDGKRFLLNSLAGDEAAWFFYGDIEKGVVKKVKTPKELYRMALEIYPIP